MGCKVSVYNSGQLNDISFGKKLLIYAEAYDKNARDLLCPGVPLNFPDQFDPSFKHLRPLLEEKSCFRPIPADLSNFEKSVFFVIFIIFVK